MRDYSRYIGIPYELNGRSYIQLDCYGLVMLLYKELHGIELPDVNCPSFIPQMSELIESESRKWTPCELKEGAVLVFNIKGYGAHVGYYIGDDYFIHTWEGTNGVTIERLGIAWGHRILGTYEWQEKEKQNQ